MQFLIDLDLAPDDGGDPFTIDQVREHLATYVFGADVQFEMSLEPGDPYHDLPGARYRTYTIPRVSVVPVGGAS